MNYFLVVYKIHQPHDWTGWEIVKSENEKTVKRDLLNKESLKGVDELDSQFEIVICVPEEHVMDALHMEKS